MASCVKNISPKNYQNLIIGFQVTVENVGDVFWDTVYMQLTIRNEKKINKHTKIIMLIKTLITICK